MGDCDFGMIGLGVMGQNLVLNIERHGFSVAGYDRDPKATDKFVTGPGAGKQISGAAELVDFVKMLKRPRRIMMMIPAGPPVDAVITQLKPHIEAGDVLIDGGNSFFEDTERRQKDLAEMGIMFIGMGVSGGEEGALNGPSLMPGGDPASYKLVEDVLTAIAARARDGKPCVAHMGPGGSGHYVKMVHNGIEYGDMQLIAESYDILKRIGGFSNAELADIFDTWNQGELNSFLIEITADIFRKQDDQGKPGELVDYVLDSAAQKGTGKWTSQNALDLGAPTHTLTAAVEARIVSSFKSEREVASKVLGGPKAQKGTFTGDKAAFVEAVRRALYCSKICAYAQGMALMYLANIDYKWSIPLGTTASIWRAGCIIRAIFLEDITAAYDAHPDLTNLLLAPKFLNAINSYQDDWRMIVSEAIKVGVPTPAFSGSLAYYDSYRSERLPANLIQAQRDLFGAHTYKRIDQDGVFHSNWDNRAHLTTDWPATSAPHKPS